MNKKYGYLRNVVLFLILFLVVSNCLLAQDTASDLKDILSRAYQAIGTDPQEAIKLFEQAATLQPLDITLQKQLGYLYILQGQTDKALEKFLAVEAAVPSDTNKLQIAYLLNSLNRNEEALTYFRQCVNSNDPDIQEKSQTAVIVLEQNNRGQKYPYWGHVYAAPYYDSRFKAGFGSLQVREGYYLNESKSLSLLGALAIFGDTKSKGATSVMPSELFSDNVLLVECGLRISPFFGFMAEVLSGFGVDLIDKGNNKKIKEDFRAIITYGNGIFPTLATPRKLQFTFKPLAEIYSSFGFYSRYHNGIGYGTIRLGARCFEWRTSTLDIYTRLDVVRDTERKYYNNIIEWGGGLRIIPDHSFGLSVLVEYHRGEYYPITNQAMTPNLYYNSFRLFLIFERPL